MFIQEFFGTKEGEAFSKLAKESCTYNAFYIYWRDALFERVMRLFIWEGTGECAPKEIEQRLLLQGYCGIMKYKGELTAFFGSLHGPTKYLDVFSQYTWRCPLDSGNAVIGKDIVLGLNTSLKNSIYPLVHHYAVLLAHAEVTFVNALVNSRDAGGVPIATTEKQKASIQQYQSAVFNGKYGVVTDIGALGIEYAGADRKTAQNIIDIYTVREKLIKSFYSDIGVRSAFEKRNNAVEAEVEADTSLLLLNLSDMIKCREDMCDDVNEMFGVNWKVHIAEEIDYGAENQRVQFDTATTVHNEKIEEGGYYGT